MLWRQPLVVVLIAEIAGLFLSLVGPRGRSAIAWFVAFVGFDLFRLRRKLILKNLDRVYGPNANPKVCISVGRASVANFVLTTLEFFAAQRVFPDYQVTFRNPDKMKTALAGGQGVYLMGIHMGNFELLGTAVGSHFARVHAPVKPIGKGRLALWVKKRREKNGIVEIVNERGVRASRTKRLMDALQNNEIVGFMVDQRRAKGLLLPFFGEPAWTNTSLISLWKQRAAPIIPVTIARTADQRAELVFHDEFVVEDRPDWTSDQFVLENAKKMNSIVEQLIVSNPEEYFWMHDRWRK
jgi:KDO2-lipid IV(A) lauroyltransferase